MEIVSRNLKHTGFYYINSANHLKNIILFRHAMPDNNSFIKDHDRPLSSTGILDAKKMGVYLTEKNEFPDIVISSTALRAKNTAELAMEEGKWNCKIIFEGGIYKGDTLFLLKFVNQLDDVLSSICLVGHEPHFSNYIAQSTGDTYHRFSKGSMASIDFDVNSWKDINMGTGNLIWRVQPKEIS